MKLNMEAIGAFIQTLRREQGMTQAELGERLNVSAQSVSNWERGESLPDVASLPDLAAVLRCSVDAILSGGAGCGGYRRHITVAQMREAISCMKRIGELMGHDHFMYRCMIDALSTRMNTDAEAALSDAHLTDVFTCECLLACLQQGDYVDPRDVQQHIPPSRAQEYVLTAMHKQGIR